MSNRIRSVAEPGTGKTGSMGSGTNNSQPHKIYRGGGLFQKAERNPF